MFNMIFPRNEAKWTKIGQASRIYVVLLSPKLPEFPRY
jgi:hypothetical protein